MNWTGMLSSTHYLMIQSEFDLYINVQRWEYITLVPPIKTGTLSYLLCLELKISNRILNISVTFWWKNQCFMTLITSLHPQCCLLCSHWFLFFFILFFYSIFMWIWVETLIHDVMSDQHVQFIFYISLKRLTLVECVLVCQ